MMPYNGFSPRERRVWNHLVRPVALHCSICGCGPEKPVGWHGEDYRRADSCRACHNAIHMRFRRPDHWQRLVRQHEHPGAWFTLLSIDPASLTRPFDETYPEGLPEPGSQWRVSRSSSAVVILGSPNTPGHSPNARLVVMITEVRS